MKLTKNQSKLYRRCVEAGVPDVFAALVRQLVDALRQDQQDFVSEVTYQAIVDAAIEAGHLWLKDRS